MSVATHPIPRKRPRRLSTTLYLEFPTISLQTNTAMLFWPPGDGRRFFASWAVISKRGRRGGGVASVDSGQTPPTPQLFFAAPTDQCLHRSASERYAIPQHPAPKHSKTASHPGGPNTAYILGCLLAKAGIRVNFVATDVSPDPDAQGIKSVLKQLLGSSTMLDDVGFLDASDRNRPLGVGYNDIFLAALHGGRRTPLVLRRN